MELKELEIDVSGALPVYRQIADGIRAAVAAGRLSPGSKLPPTRDLARTLGVNRNTVVAAYDALAGDGFVESHTGRGTFIRGARRGPVAGSATQRSWHSGFSQAVDGPGVGSLRSIYRLAIKSGGISFAGSYPAPELMPVEEFRDAMNETLRERGSEVLAYGSTSGFRPLRESIAAAMRDDGSLASADNILVTNGAQQAIALVFRALVDRGDPVVLEQPSYTGALSVLHSLGARIVPVPLDERGIRPDLLAIALERHRPRVLYLQPTFQNPTGASMDEARRRRVLEIAAAHRCTIVEDDWGSELELDVPRERSLHGIDGGRNVIYLSTFSKKLIPGLRVGWLVAPAELHERLVLLKQIEDFGTSPLIQAALHRFLQGGGLDRHLERILPAYRERRDAMLDGLEQHLGKRATWTRPGGGLFVWVRLAAGLDSNELFVMARERGVTFSRGELFHADGSGRECLRLAYGAASPERIEEGLKRLGELVRARYPAGGSGAERGTAEAVPIL